MSDDDYKNLITDKIASTLEEKGSISSSLEWSKENNFKHEVVEAVLKSLAFRQVVNLETEKFTFLKLTSEGLAALSKGTPEYRLWEILENLQLDLAECEKRLGSKEVFEVARRQAMKSKPQWLQVTKADKTQLLERSKADNIPGIVEEYEKTMKSRLQSIESNGTDMTKLDKKIIDELTRRKMVELGKSTQYKVTKGEEFDARNEVYQVDFTRDMIESGSWKDFKFKDYNFNSLGILPDHGSLHPLLKVREEILNTFIELGFEEMPTNKYVESSFWNFDALFQPQQHPTRDLHDTFFVSEPKLTTDIPMDYLEKVKSFHVSGGDSDSIGYRSDWSEYESRKNLLRTHTTAVSARMLYAVAEEYKKTGVFSPKKYFSIDRVFRNESSDATHLAEFFQVEGLIADRNLTLNHLISVLQTFFEKIGLTDLKFKPAYNPYTEPSMEVFAYHEGLGKLIEIGNSGMFRPEMLLPMGLPEDVRVVAWGLSLERPTMIKYGIQSIRQLCGHRVNLSFVKNNPIARF